LHRNKIDHQYGSIIIIITITITITITIIIIVHRDVQLGMLADDSQEQ
jgi:hypothetical protein